MRKISPKTKSADTGTISLQCTSDGCGKKRAAIGNNPANRYWFLEKFKSLILRPLLFLVFNVRNIYKPIYKGSIFGMLKLFHDATYKQTARRPTGTF